MSYHMKFDASRPETWGLKTMQNEPTKWMPDHTDEAAKMHGALNAVSESVAI
jgi:hypothetical protein